MRKAATAIAAIARFTGQAYLPFRSPVAVLTDHPQSTVDGTRASSSSPPGDPLFATVQAWSTSTTKYEVRFAKSDPGTPPTAEKQSTLARQAARKLSVPNREHASLSGWQEPHAGEA